MILDYLKEGQVRFAEPTNHERNEINKGQKGDNISQNFDPLLSTS